MEKEGLGNPVAVAAAGAKAVSWTKRNWKPLAITAGSLLTIYAGYRIYKFAFPGGISNDPKQDPSQINDSQASVLAERLYQAMYAGGTDEDAIYAALEGLNHNDYVKVSKAFGERSYFYPTGEAPVFDWMGAYLTLEEWLIQELSISEINDLKRILPEVF